MGHVIKKFWSREPYSDIINSLVRQNYLPFNKVL